MKAVAFTNSVVRKFCATKMFPTPAAQGSGSGPGEGLRPEPSRSVGAQGIAGVKLPHILGSDIAGEIVEVGEYVTGFKPGQRVLLAPMHFCNHCAAMRGRTSEPVPRIHRAWAIAVDGGNCELIAVPAVNVIPIPDSFGLQSGRQRTAGVPYRVAHAGRDAPGFARDRPCSCWARIRAWALRPSRLRNFSMPA